MAPHDRHRPGPAALAAVAAGTAVLTQSLPSVCVLGQWAPIRPRAVPGGWCRWSGPPDGGRLALTFDDGPSPADTPRTLDLLDELGLRATFFVLGSLVDAHPELIGEMVRRGHAVGSHGHRHEHHLLRTPAWIAGDFASAASALGRVGIRPRWYRPTYGQLTAWTALEARRRGMEVVLWSRWGREWALPSAEAVLDRLLPGVCPGAILLLHDTDESCPPGTAARTREVLLRLAEPIAEGAMQAVTLDDLVDPPVEPASPVSPASRP